MTTDINKLMRVYFDLGCGDWWTLRELVVYAVDSVRKIFGDSP